jgi:hypothetical protein
MSNLAVFLAGVATAGFAVAGLFFLRFWTRTRDMLFGAFGLAFFLLAAHQALITLAGIPEQYLSWAYLLKASAFTVLIVAIVRKNIGRGR